MASSVRIVHRKEFKKFASVGNFQAFLITVCLAQLADDFFFLSNGFQTASKRNFVRKRKANKARFCVKGHQLFIPSTLSVRKNSFAVHPFDLIHSKKFISRSSVQPRPFENFNKPFIHSISSVRKFSLAVHPFTLPVSDGLPSHSSRVVLKAGMPETRNAGMPEIKTRKS